MARQKILQLKHISKSFPGVLALNKIDFDLECGEVHALVGENGAGKSTLMNILSGADCPDEGEIILETKPVHFIDPRDAQENGIAMIHQELALAPTISVMENIFIGRLKRNKVGLIDYKTMRNECRIILDRLRITDITPEMIVKNLSVSQMQLIEIAKALSLHARILIMDEPTSSLTKAETGILLETISSLRDEGVGIIYISHRLEEVMQIADRVTVMRDGCRITTMNKADTSIDEIVSKMVGRVFDRTFNREPCHVEDFDDAVLEVKNLNSRKLNDISFKLRAGEVLGITGLMGAGRTELIQAIFGADKFESGGILINGKAVSIHSPYRAVQYGLGLIPEGRKTQGLFLNLSVKDNISIVKRPKYVSSGFIRGKAEAADAEAMKEKLHIKTTTIDQKIVNLSGGNQQKAIIARWLLNEPKILFLDEPTHGVDVGAKAEIYEIIDNLAKQGVSIILVSSELPEVLMLCDRILVMHNGRITGSVCKGEASQELIMSYATNQMSDRQ